MLAKTLDSDGRDLLFRLARTQRSWSERTVPDDVLRELYDVLKFGPTSGNSCPARFVFLRSVAAKERLKPHLDPGNVAKTMTAPCTVIVAYDTRFYDKLPQLAPRSDMRSSFIGKAELIESTAKRNTALQGAYLIIAARAVGLACGPMSGFDQAALDADFFADGQWKSDFLCNLGYADDTPPRPRGPRLEFDEACRLL
jgi:3-hydroxypropanoate dehydrogenase